MDNSDTNSDFINTDQPKNKFILFISGMSPKSTHAVENINKICNSFLADNYELDIVDISHEPQLAVDYQIIGIPTLVRTFPNPTRMILGDLSDTRKVLKILDIST